MYDLLTFSLQNVIIIIIICIIIALMLLLLIINRRSYCPIHDYFRHVTSVVIRCYIKARCT